MPCGVRQKRLNSVKNVILKALKGNETVVINGKQRPVEDLDTVIAWFQNHPNEIVSSVNPIDIVDAIHLFSSSAIKGQKRATTAKITRTQAGLRAINNVTKIIDSLDIGATGAAVTLQEANKVASQLAKSIGPIDQYVEMAYHNYEMSDLDYTEVKNALMGMAGQWNHLVNANGQVDMDRFNSVVSLLGNIRRVINAKNLDAKIAAHKQTLKALSSNNPNLAHMQDADKVLARKKLNTADSEYRRLQDEEARLKMEIDHKRRKIQKQIKLGNYVEEGSIGTIADALLNDKWAYKTKNAFTNSLYFIKYDLWDFVRANRFMLDMSAVGVQLGIMFPTDITLSLIRGGQKGINKLLGIEDTAPNMPFTRLYKMFTEGLIDVLADVDIRGGLGDIASETAKGGIRAGWNKFTELTTQTEGSVSKEIYQDVLNHPYYDIMIEGGLMIAESRNTHESVEYFQSETINSVPILGAIKDISEDMMVNALNAYRVNMFEQAINANPNILTSKEQLRKTADFINVLTGTVNPNHSDLGTSPAFRKIMGANALSYMFSSPRLLYSGISQASQPFKSMMNASRLMANKDLRGAAGGSYQRYQIGQMAKIMAGYGSLVTLVSMALGHGFEEDPYDTNFLRLRKGQTVVPLPGQGLTIYRLLAKMWAYTMGPPEDADTLTRDALNYKIKVQKKNLYSALYQTLLTNKMHPFMSSAVRIGTMRDFFGNPYDPMFSDSGPIKRDFLGIAEVIARETMPISSSQAIEEFDMMDKYVWEAGLLETLGNAVSSSVQTAGINIFEYDTKLRQPIVEQYQNEHEFAAFRLKNYPKELSGSRSFSPLSDEGYMWDWLRNKYSKKWGDMAGSIIESNLDKNPEYVKNMINEQEERIQREFMQQYGEMVRKLPAPEKAEKKKRNTNLFEDSGL